MELTEKDLNPDPFKQFGLWFEAAIAANLPEPNAMTLATATPEGVPSARIVLLKGFDERGFLFFSNFESRKGHELSANPNAALVLFWPTLERQIRIEGSVSRIGREESGLYYHSRPRLSQIGAWASRQSQVLRAREEFDRRVEELRLKYEGQTVPLPPFWGGYCVRPGAIEFWQARPNRLHDRFRYRRVAESQWSVERLSP